MFFFHIKLLLENIPLTKTFNKLVKCFQINVFGTVHDNGFLGNINALATIL